MPANALDGVSLGTFPGSAGDGFQRTDTDVDAVLLDTWLDPDSGAEMVELALRPRQPLEETTISIELPVTQLEALVADVQATCTE